ncbi:endonuclease V [Limibacter armeniacum]|uniref:endonuclease V n=1 Tax=Limibacter armeniacum TaxID=466084 RepID=UPI002FE67D0E
MKLAFDVQYYDTHAKAVCIRFLDWKDDEPFDIIIKEIKEVAAYVPGEFYKRELPCIMAILDELLLSEVDMIVVDGYVFLDDKKKLGLGGYLYQTLGKKIPVIGVAKSPFHQNKTQVREVYRGDSKKPLYVSAIGEDVDVAAVFVKHMDGDYRMPTLLQLLDSKTKEK